jgi:streptomycin 6-kinase
MTSYTTPALQTLMFSKGEAGKRWLEHLPQIIKKLEQDWKIKTGEIFSECYCNYVAPVETMEGQKAVLKISFPDQEFHREVEYLRLNQNGPVPKLLRVDESIPAILLEKIEPATSLVNTNDTEALPITANLLKQLWLASIPDQSFKTTHDLFLEFLKLKEEFSSLELLPKDLIEKAEEAFRTLELVPQENVFLHGDLHQFNIISDHKRGWIVIDPSGIIGEKAYELAGYIKNPPLIGRSPELRTILVNRIKTFAKLLDLDPKRIFLCTLFSTVLSVLWAYEDGTKLEDEFIQDFMKVAKMLGSIEKEEFLS